MGNWERNLLGISFWFQLDSYCMLLYSVVTGKLWISLHWGYIWGAWLDCDWRDPKLITHWFQIYRAESFLLKRESGPWRSGVTKESEWAIQICLSQMGRFGNTQVFWGSETDPGVQVRLTRKTIQALAFSLKTNVPLTRVAWTRKTEIKNS